jgi:hypothetical protein
MEKEAIIPKDAPNPLSIYAKQIGGAARAGCQPQCSSRQVNLHGWSISESAAWLSFSTTPGRKDNFGFTDVYFAPVWRMTWRISCGRMSEELSGIYHTVSRESLTKYDFGLRIAQVRLGRNLINLLPSSRAAISTPILG